jgi:hypothetical protein
MSPRKESWVSEINRLIDITIIRLAVLYPVHAASSFARKRRRWWGGKGEDEGDNRMFYLTGKGEDEGDNRMFYLTGEFVCGYI